MHSTPALRFIGFRFLSTKKAELLARGICCCSCAEVGVHTMIVVLLLLLVLEMKGI